MTLRELQELQDQFDRRFFPRFSGAEPIGDGNLEVLLYLATALSGETGELANQVKKVYRGDTKLSAAVVPISEELADVFIYTLKLATQLGIDLEGAFLGKLTSNRRRFANLGKREGT